jgi:DNA-binding IclR family transcriptional regulator
VDGTLAPQESDRIYAWRVSHLLKRGYLSRDAATQRYSLTAKGRMVAALALTLKRLMNLGEGG